MEVGQEKPTRIKNFSSAHKMNMTKPVQKASYQIQTKSGQGMHFTGQGDSNRSHCSKAVSTGIC